MTLQLNITTWLPNNPPNGPLNMKKGDASDFWNITIETLR